MEFVNNIAKIVHMEVSLHGGAPNKNIGDAFLLVWKLPKGFTSRDIPKIKDLPQLKAEPGSRRGSDPRTQGSLESGNGSADGSKGGPHTIEIHAFGSSQRAAPTGEHRCAFHYPLQIPVCQASTFAAII